LILINKANNSFIPIGRQSSNYFQLYF